MFLRPALRIRWGKCHLDDIFHLHGNHDHQWVPSCHSCPFFNHHLLNHSRHRSHSISGAAGASSLKLVLGHWLQELDTAIPCVKSDSFIGNPHPLSCDCTINVTHQFCRVGVWRGNQSSSDLV